MANRRRVDSEGRRLAEYRLKLVAQIELRPDGPFYTIDEEDLATVPATGTGVYLFCRQSRGGLCPQYVGRSKRLRQRIREHLERARLVHALSDGEPGRRMVLVATVEPRRGQSASRVAQEVESLLIRHFQSRYELVNERGTRRPVRLVRWRGATHLANLIPPTMTL